MMTQVCEWTPFPGPGKRCPVTGMSRSALRLLCVPCRENGMSPPVRSKLVKMPNQSTARRRFIDMASFREFMEAQENG
jgi:hypothetical protein